MPTFLGGAGAVSMLVEEKNVYGCRFRAQGFESLDLGSGAELREFSRRSFGSWGVILVKPRIKKYRKPYEIYAKKKPNKHRMFITLGSSTGACP